jgi:hypothetical protein
MPDQILGRTDVRMSEDARTFCAHEATLDRRLSLRESTSQSCAQAGLLYYLEKAIELAGLHFSVIGDPSVDLEQDEETGEQYLVVSIRAEGDETDCPASHKAFLSAWANAVEWPQVHLVRLIYQAV